MRWSIGEQGGDVRTLLMCLFNLIALNSPLCARVHDEACAMFMV